MDKGGTLGQKDPETQREDDFSKEGMLSIILTMER